MVSATWTASGIDECFEDSRVYELLSISRTNRVLDIFDDEAVAVASFT